ncbi:MAG: gamma carbonic anhydrase family protein [Gammaproteobacteria bacterium]|nr:MAG: gamma carbonic anhydrase family protein [Gammaproteobacteria bacterium]
MAFPISNIRRFQSLMPILGKRVYVDLAATIIGDVTLGDDCSVWPGAVIRGDMHKITIGARTSIQDGSVLHISHASDYNPGGWPLTIGDDVTIGHNVTLHGCTLGNQILVGIGSTVMDGATVEDQVVIGAGTLVPPGKTLASGYLYIGSPCKQARPLSQSELDYFTYTAANYAGLKDQYLAEM